MRPIYLDYNATTPLAPKVQAAMLPFLAEQFALPNSPGPAGEAVRQAIEDARFRLRCALGATDDHRIVFTSGGTESNNLALRGVVDNWRICDYGETCHVVVSEFESDSVLGLARRLQDTGQIDLSVVYSDAAGVVPPEAVQAELRPDTALVCVAAADSITGVRQPIPDIAAVCHDNQTLLHVDARVAFGKVNTNVEHLGADLLSLSAHRTYGPKGVGALYVRDTAVVEPIIVGDAGVGDSLRGGAPNVAGIVGFGAAAELAHSAIDESAARLMALRDRLEQSLAEVLDEHLHVWCSESDRLPNTSLMTIDGLGPLQLPAESELPLPFLIDYRPCLGWSAGEVPKGFPSWGDKIRLSVGWYTDEDEIDRAASLLLDAWERLR